MPCMHVDKQIKWSIILSIGSIGVSCTMRCILEHPYTGMSFEFFARIRSCQSRIISLLEAHIIRNIEISNWNKLIYPIHFVFHGSYPIIRYTVTDSEIYGS
jgi:hypothetical protein